MTYDEVVRMGLRKPEVEESTDLRHPGLHRWGGWMLTLKRDGETMVVKLDWETHDRLLEAHPDILFKTPHYEGYPAFLVRLEGLSGTLAQTILDASWEDAPLSAKRLPSVSLS